MDYSIHFHEYCKKKLEELKLQKKAVEAEIAHWQHAKDYMDILARKEARKDGVSAKMGNANQQNLSNREH